MEWVEWGYPLILWTQRIGDWLLLPMQFFTSLGNELFFMLVMPILLWCYDAFLGVEIGILLLFSSGINNIVKIAIALPRPYWANSSVRVYAAEAGYGFPSGHAQNALVMWGQLAVRLRRRLITAVCIILIFLISISRWYLGLHFPLDTIGGWLLAGLILFFFNRYRESFLQFFQSRPVLERIAFCLGISLLMVLGGWLAATLRQPPADLAEWAQAALRAPDGGAIQPLDLAPVLSSAGAWFGLAAGGILLHKWGGFNVKGSSLQLFLRICIGVGGLLVIYTGLKAVFPAGPSILADGCRYLRYALVGFWGVYLAPLLFMRLRLFQFAE